MKLIIAMLAAITFSTATLASTRDYVTVVGSSTVYPFATVVAEQFGKTSAFKTPKIESTGSGGGLKLFCAGVGAEYPDVTNASRAIKKSEVELCASNGVTPIEIKVGYDGIVLANSKKAATFELSTRDIFLALAKVVPDPAGTKNLIANPYETWKDVNPSLPAVKIEVLGPPPTSGTRDAFVELAMESGAKTFEWLAELRKEDKKKFKAIAHGLREDGMFIEAGENDNLIVQKLEANPAALGIFGFSFLDNNTDKVHGSIIDGVSPTFENISSQAYPVSRSLYFYVKKQHIDAIPGLREYVLEFVSDRAMGEYGYLSDKGLIPLPEDEYTSVVETANSL